MRGRAEVDRLKRRLDNTFGRARATGNPGDEVRSDLARYLYVLVLGFLEAAAKELALERCRAPGGDSTVRSYATSRLAGFRTPNAETLLQLVGAFDPAWRDQLATFLEQDGRKEAIDAVYNRRNQIVHGTAEGGSLAQVGDYYVKIAAVVEKLADIFVPV